MLILVREKTSEKGLQGVFSLNVRLLHAPSCKKLFHRWLQHQKSKSKFNVISAAVRRPARSAEFIHVGNDVRLILVGMGNGEKADRSQKRCRCSAAT